MGSIRGFRCAQCRAEILAPVRPGRVASEAAWTPPVLCCGSPLRLVDSGEGSLASLPQRRFGRCPRCGYEFRVVLHSAGAFVCTLCQTDFVISNPQREGQATTAMRTPTDG